MEFESPEAAQAWARQRRKQAKGAVSDLILIKRVTTVVEEILDYV